MIELVTLVILALASYRITRFLVIDTLTEKARSRWHDFLVSRTKFSWFFDKLHDLTSCTFCAGFWVSALVYFTYLGQFRFNRLDILSMFGIAAVQSLLHAFEPEDA